MERLGLLCRAVLEQPDITQRELAAKLDLSLGTVNHIIKEGIELGYIEPGVERGSYAVTQEGISYMEQFRVDGAVILAAGFGSRFVPLTFEAPKGLLEVFGERMIERQIGQLHEAGVTDIYIMVGYLKEKFEYLIDKYDIKLIYNPEYASKNTLATVYHAQDIMRGRNMYLLPSDNWLRENMYHAYECGSWYSAVYMEGDTSEWCMTYNKKGRITDVVIGGADSWVMYGPAFLSREDSVPFLNLIESYYKHPGTEQLHWEQVVADHCDAFPLYMNFQPEHQVYEFENLEELRAFDPRYQSKSDNEALALIAKVFHIEESDIQDIQCLKAGMTNKSFLFTVDGSHYICRIPGPGTGFLINRAEEKASYEAVSPLGIADRIIYFDGETGYKISRFYDGARNLDPKNWDEVGKCMELLKNLHHQNISVGHEFDIRKRISFYEKLCPDILFEDYREVRGWMNRLMDKLDELNRPKALAHIDSVHDNFLLLPGGGIRLIDWEYAGMCDPLIDLGMYIIYAYYDEAEADRLIEVYLGRKPTDEEQLVIYSYIALGGFLWAVWAVYKKSLGEEFGDYCITMYRYAKTYYKKICSKL